MVKIGDKLRRKITGALHIDAKEAGRRSYTGTVIWIHPEGRFCVVEFRFPQGALRECYEVPHE